MDAQTLRYETCKALKGLFEGEINDIYDEGDALWMEKADEFIADLERAGYAIQRRRE